MTEFWPVRSGLQAAGRPGRPLRGRGGDPEAVAERVGRSDTEFYYVHLCTDNAIYPHNGVFKVHNADRERIDRQWNGSRGPEPAVADEEWHDVRVTHRGGTGEIAVYLDGSADPLMTARDTTFGSGRVGFGSFDNRGRLRDLSVSGTPAA
jgi:hypothetical protein